MAININTVHQQVELLVNKAQGGGYLVAEDFNNFASIASTELFNEEYAEFQITQQITDNLKPFLLQVPLPVDQNGQVQYPLDYAYSCAIRTYKLEDYLLIKAQCDAAGKPINYNAINTTTVKIIDNDKIGWRESSSIFKPTIRKPTATFYDSYLQCKPVDLGVILLDYFRYPAIPVWGFTLGLNGLPAYNAATSTDFDWDAVSINKILCKICKYFGVEVREEELTKSMITLEQGNP